MIEKRSRFNFSMKYISKIQQVFLVVFIFVFIYKMLSHGTDIPVVTTSSQVWNIQSIDTMKFSRDLARERLNDKEFGLVINEQVKAIADAGATHVAIGTPYEEEFVPYLTRWVDAARANNLHVWFRGNLAGWEGWFNYPRISTEEHTKQVVSFITKHQELFSEGDIFTSCPECENGGPGDPRSTNDLTGFRNFLISEHNQVKETFRKTGKNVIVGLYSMNGDVAKLAMDQETTKALGGYVSVDHYVVTPQQLSDDVTTLAKSSGGKVVLGEWGAPIPDINGKMTDQEQANWIAEALSLLSQNRDLYGLNYWTSLGSSTAIWDGKGKPRPAVDILKAYYEPQNVSGSIINEIENNVEGVSVKTSLSEVYTDSRGRFSLNFIPVDKKLMISAEGYLPQTLDASQINAPITLVKVHENVLFSFAKFLKHLQK